MIQTMGDVTGIEFLPDESEVAPAVDGVRTHSLNRGRLDLGNRISNDLSEALERLREITDGSA